MSYIDNKNREVSIILSKYHDVDLIGFYHKVGKKSFHKIMKYAVLSLKDSAYLNDLKVELLKSISNPLESAIDFDNNIHVRLSFSGDNAAFINSLTPKVRKRQLSSLIKQLTRYCIGFEHLLPFYLDTIVSFEKKEITRLEISGIENSSRTKRKTRVVTSQISSKKQTSNISTVKPIKLEKTEETHSSDAETFHNSNIPNTDEAPISSASNLEYETIDLSFDDDITPSNTVDDFDPLAALMNLIN